MLYYSKEKAVAELESFPIIPERISEKLLDIGGSGLLSGVFLYREDWFSLVSARVELFTWSTSELCSSSPDTRFPLEIAFLSALPVASCSGYDTLDSSSADAAFKSPFSVITSSGWTASDGSSGETFVWVLRVSFLATFAYCSLKLRAPVLISSGLEFLGTRPANRKSGLLKYEPNTRELILLFLELPYLIKNL